MTTNGQTRQLKKEFLEDFAQTGNVSESARNVGVVRQTVYLWKDRDKKFLEAYEQAEIEATERLEQEARRRGAEGYDEPVFGMIGGGMAGEIGTIRKYSDTLLIFLLKGRAPDKYRERVSQEHTGRNGGPIRIAPTDPTGNEEYAAVRAAERAYLSTIGLKSADLGVRESDAGTPDSGKDSL